MPTVTTPIMTDATGRLIASAIVASSTTPAEMTIADDGVVTQELVANVAYHFTGNITSLTITLGATTGTALYHFDFIAGSTAPTLSIPSTVKMPDGFSIGENTRYEVDILNNYGAVASWTNS